MRPGPASSGLGFDSLAAHQFWMSQDFRCSRHPHNPELSLGSGLLLARAGSAAEGVVVAGGRGTEEQLVEQFAGRAMLLRHRLCPHVYRKINFVNLVTTAAPTAYWLSKIWPPVAGESSGSTENPLQGLRRLPTGRFLQDPLQPGLSRLVQPVQARRSSLLGRHKRPTCPPPVMPCLHILVRYRFPVVSLRPHTPRGGS